jgi:hypothetical protein
VLRRGGQADRSCSSRPFFATTSETSDSAASIGPPPLAVVREVRKADGMMQGPLPFLELVKTYGSGDTTVRPLAGMTVPLAAGAYKFVCT